MDSHLSTLILVLVEHLPLERLSGHETFALVLFMLVFAVGIRTIRWRRPVPLHSAVFFSLLLLALVMYLGERFDR